MIQIADLRVGNLMTLDPVVIDPDATAAEAESMLKTYRVSGLPVVRTGEAIGVISQSDLVVARSSGMIAANWPRLRVRHLMSSPAVTVHVDASVRQAAHEMLARHIHRLVVIADDGAPIGVVTPLDLLRSILEDPDDSIS
jgi:CBS domain-containing protein